MKPSSTLRLRKLYVDRFKALEQIELRIQGDFLVLIGPNGAGKSSVLQVLAFVHYFVQGKPDQFFSDRGWLADDTRSISTGSPFFSIALLLESDDGTSAVWHFSWGVRSGKTFRESLWIRESGSADLFPLFRYKSQPGKLNLTNIGEKEIPGLNPNGSIMSVLEIAHLHPRFASILTAIQAWATGILSLELLSPKEMRRGARGGATDLGHRGERLAGFLSSLDPARKERLTRRLALFYPALRTLETRRKRAGWIDLQLTESFSARQIGADHMSDGFMRLLALVSIPEFGENIRLVLLDEIEDGIDPHILTDLVEQIRRESATQLIATSHSPLLVNLFDPKDVHFMTRSEEGMSITASFDEIEHVRKHLEYRGIGEIWAQTSLTSLSAWIREAAASRMTKKTADEELLVTRDTELSVKHFMEGS